MEFPIPEYIECPACEFKIGIPNTSQLANDVGTLKVGMIIQHINCGQRFEIVPDSLKARSYDEIEKFGPNPWDWRVKQS